MSLRYQTTGCQAAGGSPSRSNPSATNTAAPSSMAILLPRLCLFGFIVKLNPLLRAACSSPQSAELLPFKVQLPCPCRRHKTLSRQGEAAEGEVQVACEQVALRKSFRLPPIRNAAGT